MKIYFLIHSMRYGGANKVLVDIANFLVSRNHKVGIVTYLNDERFYILDDRIEILNIYTVFDKKRGIRRIGQTLKLRRILKRNNVDVLIAFDNTAKLMGVTATILLKSKMIISERLDPYNYIPGRKNTMHTRYKLADGCVFQTEGAANYFPENVITKSVVIPNFINNYSQKALPFEMRENEIAFVARLDIKQKRQDLMIKAFKRVSIAFPDMKLVFYGGGPDEEYLRNLVNKMGLSNQVNFNGVVKEVKESIIKSKLFVMTSDYEGVPNALMEAMSLGLPVVSTDCSPGGAKLLIKDQENGLLVPRDNEEKLADAIIRILNNPDFADALGHEAKKINENYHPNVILPKWEEYIRKTVNN
ncbi:glycosyltransferase family 4 protein [Planococcus sp. MERTA32b]|nr:glycosyltransferase family 4 protein [Planococcus sp. MER TA 32b]